jgi:hypothetical protein
MCWTINTGTGRSAGSCGRTRASASGPRVDRPIATTSTRPVARHDVGAELLEFGYWTEEPALVKGAERFLVELMRSSEGLDPNADSFDPDLAPVDYDDVAMAEAWAEMRWAQAEEEAV